MCVPAIQYCSETLAACRPCKFVRCAKMRMQCMYCDEWPCISCVFQMTRGRVRTQQKHVWTPNWRSGLPCRQGQGRSRRRWWPLCVYVSCLVQAHMMHTQDRENHCKVAAHNTRHVAVQGQSLMLCLYMFVASIRGKRAIQWTGEGCVCVHTYCLC
jgi:hypothetical protein